MPIQEKLSSTLIAGYVAAYNVFLDEVFGLDINYVHILAELDLVLKAYNESAYAITVGSDLNLAAQENLTTIFEYYNSDDVEPKYLEHFQEIIKARLSDYIAQLKNLSPNALQDFTIEQRRLHTVKQEQIAANRLKQQQLQQFLTSKQDKTISADKLLEIQEFRIDPRTKGPEALICLDIEKLLKRVAETLKEIDKIEAKFTGEESELEKNITNATITSLEQINYEYNNLMQLIFALETKQPNLGHLDLLCLQDKLEALLGMFNASLNKHTDIKQLCDSEKTVILDNVSTVAQLLVNLPQQTVFGLFVPCLKIRAGLRALNTISNLEAKQEASNELVCQAQAMFQQHNLLELDVTKLSPQKLESIIDNTINILKHPSIDIAEFMQYSMPFKKHILSEPNKLFILVKTYGLKLKQVADRDREVLNFLNKEHELITDLLSGTDLSFEMLFERDDDLFLALEFYAQSIVRFSRKTGIPASRLFARDITEAQIYRIYTDIEWLTVLVNYYFIPIETILKLEPAEFNNLLGNPSYAPEYLKSMNKACPVAAMGKIIHANMSDARLNLQALNSNGITSHLEKVLAMPQKLAAELISAGVSFIQAREIYLAFVEINNTFANKFVDGMHPSANAYQYELSKQLLTNLKQLFSTKEYTLISKLLTEYTTVFASAVSKEHVMPAEWNEETIYIDIFEQELTDGQIYEANLHILKFIEKAFNINCKSTLCTKHIALYHHIIDSKMCTYFADFDAPWKLAASNWKQHLAKKTSSEEFSKLLVDESGEICEEADIFRRIYEHLAYVQYLIDSHVSLPVTNIFINNAAGENSLFKAIDNKDYNDTVRLLNFTGKNPTSEKGLSLITTAALSKDRMILSAVKQSVRKTLKNKLADFLLAHKFKDVAATNNEGETVITAALKLNKPYIVQAVLANSINIIHGEIVIPEHILRPNARKETPLMVAQRLGNHSATMEFIELSRFTRAKLANNTQPGCLSVFKLRRVW